MAQLERDAAAPGGLAGPLELGAEVLHALTVAAPQPGDPTELRASACETSRSPLSTGLASPASGVAAAGLHWSS